MKNSPTFGSCRFTFVFCRVLFVLSSVFLLANNCFADSRFYNGTVIYVTDGDTAAIKLESGKIKKIRFYGVDCPEKEWPEKWPAQPYAKEAKQFVVDLIDGKVVTVRLKGDRSGKREIGEVFVDGVSVSRELLRAGLGWWNKKYQPDDYDLQRLQEYAKKRKIGLWKQRDPEPPWKFRRRYSD